MVQLYSAKLKHQLVGLANSWITEHPISHRARCLDQGHTWLEYERPVSRQNRETDVCKWCGLIGMCLDG